MIALYIIIGIIALIAAILCVRVGINIVFEEELAVYLKVLFLRFRLYPQKKKKFKPKKHGKKREKAKKPDTVVKDVHSEPKKKPPITETIATVTELIKAFSAAFARKLHVRLAKISIKIATGDAAQTAILYGAASGAMACLIDLLDSITSLSSLRRSEISVVPDFTSEHTEARINISLSVSVFGALTVLIKTLLKYLSLKIKNNRKETEENG